MSDFAFIGPVEDDSVLDDFTYEDVRESHCVASTSKFICEHLVNKSKDENKKYVTVCIPAYNEGFEEMIQTITSLMENFQYLRNRVKTQGGLTLENMNNEFMNTIPVLVPIFDGTKALSGSMNQFLTQNFPGLMYEMTGPSKPGAVDVRISCSKWWYYDPAHAQTGVVKQSSSLFQQSNKQKQKTTNKSTSMRCKRVRVNGTAAHAVENDITGLDDEDVFYYYLCPIVKRSNHRKHNSHQWFFDSICEGLEKSVSYAFLTDCGTAFDYACVYRLVQELYFRDDIVGVTARQRVSIPNRFFHPCDDAPVSWMQGDHSDTKHDPCWKCWVCFMLSPAPLQGFEFEASPILSCAMFNMIEALPVMPGPCQLMDWQKMKEYRVVDEYFNLLFEGEAERKLPKLPKHFKHMKTAKTGRSTRIVSQSRLHLQLDSHFGRYLVPSIVLDSASRNVRQSVAMRTVQAGIKEKEEAGLPYPHTHTPKSLRIRPVSNSHSVSASHSSSGGAGSMLIEEEGLPTTHSNSSEDQPLPPVTNTSSSSSGIYLSNSPSSHNSPSSASSPSKVVYDDEDTAEHTAVHTAEHTAVHTAVDTVAEEVVEEVVYDLVDRVALAAGEIEEEAEAEEVVDEVEEEVVYEEVLPRVVCVVRNSANEEELVDITDSTRNTTTNTSRSVSAPVSAPVRSAMSTTHSHTPNTRNTKKTRKSVTINTMSTTGNTTGTTSHKKKTNTPTPGLRPGVTPGPALSPASKPFTFTEFLRVNMRLAEDRILSFVSVFSTGAGTIWVPGATFYYRPEIQWTTLLTQRRRWLNGTVAAFLFSFMSKRARIRIDGGLFDNHKPGRWKSVVDFLWLLQLFQTVFVVLSPAVFGSAGYIGLVQSAELFPALFGWARTVLFTTSVEAKVFEVTVSEAWIGVYMLLYVYWTYLSSTADRGRIPEYLCVFMAGYGAAYMIPVYFTVWYTIYLHGMNVIGGLVITNLFVPVCISLAENTTAALLYLLYLPWFLSLINFFIVLIPAYSFARLWDTTWGNRATGKDSAINDTAEDTMKRYNAVFVCVVVSVNVSLVYGLVVLFAYGTVAILSFMFLMFAPIVVQLVLSSAFLFGVHPYRQYVRRREEARRREARRLEEVQAGLVGQGAGAGRTVPDFAGKLSGANPLDIHARTGTNTGITNTGNTYGNNTGTTYTGNNTTYTGTSLLVMDGSAHSMTTSRMYATGNGTGNASGYYTGNDTGYGYGMDDSTNGNTGNGYGNTGNGYGNTGNSYSPYSQYNASYATLLPPLFSSHDTGNNISTYHYPVTAFPTTNMSQTMSMSENMSMSKTHLSNGHLETVVEEGTVLDSRDELEETAKQLGVELKPPGLQALSSGSYDSTTDKHLLVIPVDEEEGGVSGGETGALSGGPTAYSTGYSMYYHTNTNNDYQYHTNTTTTSLLVPVTGNMMPPLPPSSNGNGTGNGTTGMHYRYPGGSNTGSNAGTVTGSVTGSVRSSGGVPSISSLGSLHPLPPALSPALPYPPHIRSSPGTTPGTPTSTSHHSDTTGNTFTTHHTGNTGTTGNTGIIPLVNGNTGNGAKSPAQTARSPEAAEQLRSLYYESVQKLASNAEKQASKRTAPSHAPKYLDAQEEEYVDGYMAMRSSTL